MSYLSRLLKRGNYRRLPFRHELHGLHFASLPPRRFEDRFIVIRGVDVGQTWILENAPTGEEFELKAHGAGVLLLRRHNRTQRTLPYLSPQMTLLVDRKKENA